jgi:hypothetical protein
LQFKDPFEPIHIILQEAEGNNATDAYT